MSRCNPSVMSLHVPISHQLRSLACLWLVGGFTFSPVNMNVISLIPYNLGKSDLSLILFGTITFKFSVVCPLISSGTDVYLTMLHDLALCSPGWTHNLLIAAQTSIIGVYLKVSFAVMKSQSNLGRK